MNKVYYDLAIREAYQKGCADTNARYADIVLFLESISTKSHHQVKTVKSLLEKLKQ